MDRVIARDVEDVPALHRRLAAHAGDDKAMGGNRKWFSWGVIFIAARSLLAFCGSWCVITKPRDCLTAGWRPTFCGMRFIPAKSLKHRYVAQPLQIASPCGWSAIARRPSALFPRGGVNSHGDIRPLPNRGERRKHFQKPEGKRREPSGQHQEADGPEQKAHDALDLRHVAFHPAHQAGEAWQEGGDQQERHAEADGVDRQQEGAARDRAFAGGQRQDRAQLRPDARRPAKGEGQAQDIGAERPCRPGRPASIRASRSRKPMR